MNVSCLDDHLYVLFIHYALREDQDWERGLDSTIQLKDTTTEQLRKDVEYLKRLLEPRQGWHGFAFLFLDPQWTELLGTDKSRFEAALLGARLANLQNQLQGLVAGCIPIRFLTAATLLQLLVILEDGAPQENQASIWEYLSGGKHGLFYDGPKVVEAVIRIANFSRNAPILRFDDDVIFYGSRYAEGTVDETRNNILELCERYKKLSDHPDIHYFLFSGSYIQPTEALFFKGEHPGNAETFSEDQLVRDAVNCFATRIVQLAKVPQDKKWYALPWEDEKAPEENKAEKQAAQVELRVIRCFLETLWKIGANPFRQVISGAGLCLSDSAILDLSPFSNMRQFVMWIDDHLKFSLHHELRHFGLPRAATKGGPGKAELPRIGRVDGVWFRQCRHSRFQDGMRVEQSPTLADAAWHIREYLPRLLRGCIVDSWLREDARLKRQAKDYKPAEWSEIIQKAQGAYARYFIQSLIEGRNEQRDKEIKKYLWLKARKRLEEVVSLWSGEDYSGTFLHMFVVGKEGTAGQFEYAPVWDEWSRRRLFPPSMPDGLAVALKEFPQEIPTPGPQLAGLAALVLDLIDDFIGYVDFVRFWMSFVQSTRYLLNTRSERESVFWAFPAEYPPNRESEEGVEVTIHAGTVKNAEMRTAGPKLKTGRAQSERRRKDSRKA